MADRRRPRTAAAVSRAAGDHTKIRTFLLDDHELMRRGLRDLLAGTPDIDVVGEAGTARQAEARILALRPDVAVLDVRLPDGSGIEVCRRVRSRDPRIRALMLTTYDDEQSRMAAVLAGSSGFVLKQICGTELIDAVRRVAAGESILEQPSGDRIRAPDADCDSRLASLTAREQRILDLITEGLTNGQIGERLGITEKTVRNHVTKVLAKLGMSGRTQAAVYAVRHDRQL